MKNTLILFLSIFLVSSCGFIDLDPKSTTNLSTITIKSGQSFGFCVGKCHAEMTIKDQHVNFLVKERNFESGVLENKEYAYKDVLSAQKVSDIEKLIDTQKFFNLNDVYGCPDCADGGSEWIEIITADDKSKKVTFEYGKTVPEIEKLIKLLREEREALSSKYMKQ
ncbi:hypothetical protein [Lacihabitans sp. CCS-44]|uniref:hypothetical protein n=1 Tax=Lacihabitans sp. CCS-44 TaxID=2487331 RepID=UPI0020CB7E60|nr:hypothetical protein [Lacihabitans sp. CCS-44]